MKLKAFLIFFLVTSCVLGLQAQDKSNRGKEFWLAYGFDYSFFNETPVNEQELAIYISTQQQAATVTVSITNTGYTQTLNIPANTVDATILIPKSGANDARTLSDGLQNRGIHIVSDVPVATYAHVYATMVSGATMLMPVETYGYVYHSINYTQATSNSPLPVISPTTANGPDWYSWFYVIASEDNTRIQITPSDTTKNGWLPGLTYTVNLNKGESYHVFGKLNSASTENWAASKDMTGSKLVSVLGADGTCHPVAVFSGSGGIRLCRGDGGEFVHQQVFPAQAWGTRYLTYHTINNTNTDILPTNRNYYRVCVLDPATVVKKNGVVMTGMVKNFFYEYMDSTGGDYIEADKPILVAQYTPNKNQCWNFPTTTPAPPSYGDPEMFYLSPIEQGQKSVLFYASRKSSIDYVYTNIILPTAGVASLKVDGNSLPASQIIPHPNLPSYSVALARYIGPAAQHSITSDSAFNATVYGLGNYESYGYNVGTLINNLNTYSAIKNTFNTSGNVDTFTCPKTPVRLFVKLGYQATSITWKLSQVAGITPNTDSVIANPIPVYNQLINGRSYYVYSLQQDFIFANSGTYTIPVTFSSVVIPNCNQTDTTSIRVVVKPGPVADFSIANVGCLKDTVAFTGIATPGSFTLSSYLWNFNDGSTQTTINAKKRFTTSGTQNIRYRIYADNGCAADTTKTISIFPESISKLGASTPSCDSVLISDTSIISSGIIKTWRYFFGDGPGGVATNSNTPFYHVYSLPGTYTIKLVTISDNNCISDTAYKTVTIFGRPIAKFGYDRNICIGDSIHITDTSSIAGGTIISWQYDFGDGNTLTRNVSSPFYHAYTTSGTYIVKLVTTSALGCTSPVFQKTVIVAAKPVTSFSYAGNACVGSMITFTSGFTNNTNTSWYWNFGDAQTLTTTAGNSTTHAYALPLTNVLVKHAVSVGGCVSDTSFITIPVINPTPVASFSIKKDIVCENKPVLFTSAVTGINSWAWSFGNGTGTAAAPFNRTYTTAGTYNISLVVTDASGCTSLPATDVLIVNPVPQVNAGADKIIQTGSAVLLDATVSPAGNYSYLWTPPAGLNSATILQPLTSTAATTTYLLKVENVNSHCTAADDVVVSVISKLFIANTFTPNGDGNNDVWKIPGMALYPNGVVLIFNRYGQVIFQSSNYVSHPWDGTYKGQQQPSGSFIYLIKLNDSQNQIIQGTVTIIR